MAAGPAVGAAPPPSAVATTAAPPAVPSPSPSRPRPSASPSRSQPAPARPLAAGPVSLEPDNGPGLFVTTAGGLGVLQPLSAGSGAAARRQATFEAVAGLNDAKCFSFRAADGRYLRHSSWRLRLDAQNSTALFRGDATFCVRAGAVTGTVLLESSNYPGWFVHRRGSEMWVDHSDGSAAFLADSYFRVRPPLAA
ncbi:AbfB domain-containing protein [Catellatospora sp. NPDC049609]|uniref:AbfB domain-containing protein n=1 Tax=Catellatospora sp. NPDC049609 TaxID=3155505 RepID=UPI0034468346